MTKDFLAVASIYDSMSLFSRKYKSGEASESQDMDSSVCLSLYHKTQRHANLSKKIACIFARVI